MNYYVFIDETGDFIIKNNMNNTNYVGGWICTHEIKDLENKLVSTVRSFLQQEKLSFHFSIPDHLHFMPLHIPAMRKGRENHINSVPLEYVQPLLTKIFSIIKNEVFLIFRSTGFPHFYANEQASYIEILRSTIYQLIDDLKITSKDKLEIVIAARRVKELLGQFSINNIKFYEKKLIESFHKEIIKDVFEYKKLKNNQIRIVVDDARKNTSLAVADLFCGALRWEKYNYLEKFQQKIKSFDIHNAFINIPNRATSIIDNIYEHDPAMGLLSAFETLSKNKNQSELIQYVDTLCQKIHPDDKQNFNKELRRYLNEKLVDDPNRYQNLDQINIFIHEITKRFNDIHIVGTLKYYYIKLLSHQGSTDLQPVHDYYQFLELYGPLLHGNMYIVAQERLEAILTIVHPAAFNIFKFERVEQYLSEEIKKYESIFPDVEGRIDETRARLEGTMGQMYGFLCDYPGNESMFEKALDYLKKDVKHCILYSKYWEQGMGYLTSLYFKKRKLNKAIQSFKRETRSEKEKTDNIYNLSKLLLFKSNEGDFFLLHRLYICALANKINKKEIKSTKELMKKLLKNNKLSKYPICLSVKWLSVIFAQKGDIDTALKILQKIDTTPTQDFTIDVIKLPIKILIHFYKKKLNISSSFNLDNELNLLEKHEKGIKENLLLLGIDKINENTDYFDAAQILPFYYS